MTVLTDRQQQVLQIIQSEFEKTGEMPSLSRIAEVLGVRSKNGIVGHVRALEKKGVLRHRSARASSFAFSDEEVGEVGSKAALRLPIAASIPAGVPRQAFDQADRYFEFAPDFFGRGQLSAVTITGNSMAGDAICDGDIAILQLQKEAEKNAVVAVRVNGDEVTLKRIRRRPGASGAYVDLIPSNPDFAIRTVLAADVEILGKLVGIIRKT